MASILNWKGTIDAAHFIPGHPKCGRLHGHTYTIKIQIHGDVPKKHPMYLLDFAEIKDVVNKLDHRLIVPNLHQQIRVEEKLDEDGSSKYYKIVWADGIIHLKQDAVALIQAPESSSECLAKWIHGQVSNKFPTPFQRIRVVVSETPNTNAVYR